MKTLADIWSVSPAIAVFIVLVAIVAIVAIPVIASTMLADKRERAWRDPAARRATLARMLARPCDPADRVASVRTTLVRPEVIEVPAAGRTVAGHARARA